MASLPAAGVTDAKLVELMTGQAITQTRFELAAGDRPKLLEVRGLSRAHNFEDVSFDLHAGEIVGITGLIGSGRTELALALFGISPAERGEIKVEGKPVRISSVTQAVEARHRLRPREPDGAGAGDEAHGGGEHHRRHPRSAAGPGRPGRRGAQGGRGGGVDPVAGR